MEALNVILPVLLYIFGIILLVVLIVLGIRLIQILERVEKLADKAGKLIEKAESLTENVEEKINALDGAFHLINQTTSGMSLFGDAFMGAINKIIAIVFKKER